MHPYKKLNQTLRQALIAATLSTALVMVGCGSSSSSNDNKPQAGQGNGNSDNNSNNNSDNNTNNSSPLFSVRGDWAIMDGDITSNIVNQLNKLVTDYPQVKTIVMANVPGSSDDEMNLKAGLRLRELGLIPTCHPAVKLLPAVSTYFLPEKNVLRHLTYWLVFIPGPAMVSTMPAPCHGIMRHINPTWITTNPSVLMKTFTGSPLKLPMPRIFTG